MAVLEGLLGWYLWSCLLLLVVNHPLQVIQEEAVVLRKICLPFIGLETNKTVSMAKAKELLQVVFFLNTEVRMDHSDGSWSIWPKLRSIVTNGPHLLVLSDGREWKIWSFLPEYSARSFSSLEILVAKELIKVFLRFCVFSLTKFGASTLLFFRAVPS